MSVWQGLLDTILTGADEAAMPSVRKFMKGLARFGVNNPMAQAVLKGINPKTLDMARAIGPTAVSGMMGAVLKDEYFPNDKIAHLVKGGLSDFFVELADQTAPGQKPDPAVVEQVANDVLGEMLVYANSTRLIHMQGCPEIMGKRTKMTVDMALNRQYHVAPCCFPELQQKLQKMEDAGKFKSEAPIRSAFDAINRLESVEDKKLLLTWMSGLSEEQRTILATHLDSMDEVEMLVLGVKEGMHADDLLHYLEEQSTRSQFKRNAADVANFFVDLFGKGAEKVVDVAKCAGSKFDKDVMDPVADGLEQLQQHIDNRVQNPPTKKKLGLMARIRRALRLF